MKKIVSILMVLVVCLSMSMVCFAGDTDRALLVEDDALVFIGKVEDFVITDEEDDYPSTEYTITLTPIKKIKGEVVLDKSVKYENVRTGKLKLKNDTEYLFGYFKELVVWELDSYDNLLSWETDKYSKDSIILKERHNNSIDTSMQELLNDNSFEKAEQERLEKINKAETSSTSVIGGADAPTDIIIKSNINIAVVVCIGVFALAFIIGFIYKKRKNKK